MCRDLIITVENCLLFSILNSIQRELFTSALAMAPWRGGRASCPFTLGLVKEDVSGWDMTKPWTRASAFRLLFPYISDPP